MRTARLKSAIVVCVAGVCSSLVGTGDLMAQQHSPSSEQNIVDATNAYRRSRGLATLRSNSRLMRAAQGHAQNMARLERMSHVLNGSRLEDRVRAVAYSYRNIAENVAYNSGYRDPAAQAMDGWKRSPGHNANMLSREVTEIGVGVYRSRSGKVYFCQVFGRPSQSSGGSGPGITPGLVTGYVFNGRLSSSDRQRNGKYFDTHTVRLQRGRRYQFDLTSNDFDTYLLLLNSSGSVIKSNDDGGSGRNSRIFYTPSRSGRYFLVVTSYGSGKRGRYKLIGR